MTNTILAKYSEQYINSFNTIFEIAEDGSFNMDNAQTVEAWYNSSNILIGLVTGLPVTEIKFNGDKDENIKKMMHVYSVSYMALLQMCKILGRDVPTYKI